MIARTVSLMMLALLALASCATGPTANVERTWVLWAVHQEVLTSPEILRPVETYRTKQECEAHKAAQIRVQLAEFDKLDRENQQRATEAAIVVKNLRDKRGWTQAELAERAAVTERVISQVESGASMSLGIVEEVKLAKALGVKELGGWHAPKNVVSQIQCWPDTIDPRGPKGK